MPTYYGSNTAKALADREAADGAQDLRLDSVEADNTTQDGRLDALEGLPPARVLEPYLSGQSVLEGSIVTDDEWLMYALADTSELAAPRPTGYPSWVYQGDALAEQIISAKSVIFGARYTYPVDAYTNGYRIYAYEGFAYEIYFVIDPLGIKDIRFELSFTATETGWREFTFTPIIIAAGQVYDLLAVVDEPDPAATTWIGNWNYLKPNNPAVPTSGQIVHANKSSNELRINKTDDDAGDRSTELLALIPGDRIRGSGGIWTVQSSTDNGTYVSFYVLPETQGSTTGIQQFDFDTVTAVDISYGVDAAYWAGNVSVEGLFIADGAYDDIVPINDAFGVDINVQEVSMSADWKVLAAPSGGTGIGSGGGGDGGGTTYLKDREELGNQAANVDWNWANGAYGFTVTLTGNALVAEPANPPAPVNGQYVDGILTLIQDATGSRQPTWDSVWRNAPTLAAAADSSAAIPFHFDGVDYVLGAPVEYVQPAPPPPGDAFWASVSLLLSFDGTDGDTTFPDTSSMSPTVSRVAPAVLDDAQQKFGATSLECLGSGGYADCTINAIGTGDFTAECWVRLSALNTYNALFIVGSGTGTTVVIVYVDGSGHLRIYSASEYDMGQAITLVVDTWYHICLQRDGDEFRVSVDGEHCGYPRVVTPRDFATQVRIGGPTVSGYAAFVGHLDEFRFTEANVRYPGWFVPSIEAFPVASGTFSGEVGFCGSQANQTMASASSQLSASFTPAEGFDGISYDASGANAWLSSEASLTPWYQLNFGTAKEISAVRLKPRQHANRHSPNACTLRVGSDPTFAASDQDTPITFPEPALGDWTPWQTIGTTVSALYLRLEVDTRHIVGTGNWTGIQEIEFKEIV